MWIIDSGWRAHRRPYKAAKGDAQMDIYNLGDVTSTHRRPGRAFPYLRHLRRIRQTNRQLLIRDTTRSGCGAHGHARHRGQGEADNATPPLVEPAETDRRAENKKPRPYRVWPGLSRISGWPRGNDQPAKIEESAGGEISRAPALRL
jgi:hypothetical protein